MKGVVYLETSAVLRILIEGDKQLARDLSKTRKIVTSSLTRVESERGLGRAEREGRIDGRGRRERHAWLRKFLRNCDEIELSDEVLSRAAADFPFEPVRTLDALHLASALVWETVGASVVVSCDERVRANAAALGMKIVP